MAKHNSSVTCIIDEIREYTTFTDKSFTNVIQAAQYECFVQKAWGIRKAPNPGHRDDDKTLLEQISQHRSRIGCNKTLVTSATSSLALSASSSSAAASHKRIHLVAIVKDQAQDILSWLIWHFLLGVDKIVIYDNDSQDDLRGAVSPFERLGLVEYYKWPGQQQQIPIYNHELARSARAMRSEKAGTTSAPHFIGFIDIDEFLAPYRHVCLDHLLSICKGPSCGGIKVNWRTVVHEGLSIPAQDTPARIAFFQDIGYDVGNIGSTIKSIIRVRPDLDGEVVFENPHAIHYKPTYRGRAKPMIAVNGSDIYPMNPKIPTDSASLKPPLSTPAVIMHVHGGSRLDWVMKRLMRRQVYESTKKRRICHECDKTLMEVLIEFGAKVRAGRARYQASALEINDALSHSALQSFLQRVDHSTLAVLQSSTFNVPTSML